MCEQITLENVNDIPEADFEDWEMIFHEDVQSSDAESVEIINEEEAVQTNLINIDENIELLEVKDESKGRNLLLPKDLNIQDLNLQCYSFSEGGNSRVLEGGGVGYICLLIFVIGFTSLITPQADLMQELEEHRLKNEILKQHVKDLSKVISDLQSGYNPLNEQFDRVEIPKPPQNTSDPQFFQTLNILNDIVDLHRKFISLSNRTELFKFTKSSKNINYSDVPTEIKHFLLLQKVTDYLKQITINMSEQKVNILRLNQINAFSEILHKDFSIKLERIGKYILKNINKMVQSFFKKMCKFKINNLINCQECNENKLCSIGRGYENGKAGKLNKQENMIKVENEFSKRKYKENNLGKSEWLNKIKLVRNNGKYENLLSKHNKDGLNNNINEMKVLNNENLLIPSNDILEDDNNRSKQAIRKENTCIADNKIKCNHKSEYGDNWFINIGNQRTKIRTSEAKGDWLFNRARGRRGNMIVDQPRRKFQNKYNHEDIKKNSFNGEKEQYINEDRFDNQRNKYSDKEWRKENFNENHRGKRFYKLPSRLAYFHDLFVKQLPQDLKKLYKSLIVDSLPFRLVF